MRRLRLFILGQNPSEFSYFDGKRKDPKSFHLMFAIMEGVQELPSLTAIRSVMLPLPGSAVQVVAYISIATDRIVPQTSVQWKRLIKLVDALAGVIDGGWVVSGDRRWRHDARGASGAR